MKYRLAKGACAALLLFALLPVLAHAREKPIPKDIDKFTTFVAERMAEAMPELKVSITGPLSVGIVVAGEPSTVRLNAIWDFCERDRRRCREQIEDYVTTTSSMLREAGEIEQIRPSDIRLVVRGPAYIEDLKNVAAGRPDFVGVFRPVAGDLWLICVADRPHGVQPLRQSDLAKLGLTEDQTIALGLKNLAAALPALAADTHVMKPGLTFAAGDFYESSRMLLHDSWAEMSRAMGGHLVVAVPETDVIIYGNGGGNGDRLVLSAFAQTMAEKAPKPISVSLFEWTPDGWQVVTP
jgi:uncharacterized protein YtpQ (UPF0354 family)